MKAVFLDRDGTINVDYHFVHRVEDFEYVPGALEGLRFLQNLGYVPVIVTNQSGIARGFFREKDFEELTKWMVQDLKKQGIAISGVYYCPHLPEGKVKKYRKSCDCRKPRTALFWKAASELKIDMDHSIAVGDTLRDLSICQECGVKGFLLSETEVPDLPGNVTCVKSWMELMKYRKMLEQL